MLKSECIIMNNRNELISKTQHLQALHPYEMFLKDVGRVPTEECYDDYLASLQALLNQDKKNTDIEEQYIKARLGWQNLVGNTHQLNEEYKKHTM